MANAKICLFQFMPICGASQSTDAIITRLSIVALIGGDEEMSTRIEHAHERRGEAYKQHVGKHHTQQLQHEFRFGFKLMRRQHDGNAKQKQARQ